MKYAKHMQCGKGCTACCYGLFDITIADAVQVARGLKKLPSHLRDEVVKKAENLHDGIRRFAPAAPVLLAEDDPRSDAIVDGAGSAPCPFLGNAGECLIYDDRPTACRLEGVPMIDTRSGVFGDWCDLNFTHGIPGAAIEDLRLDYDALDAREEMRSAEIAVRARMSDIRAVTFIPSVIADFNYWASLATREPLM